MISTVERTRCLDQATVARHRLDAMETWTTALRRAATAALEVADIFRNHGPAWRLAHAGHVSLDQLKVMSAIERCRSRSSSIE
jgi:hypothetical protein